MARQTHVTPPTQVVTGTRKQKNQYVKDMWIDQLGGCCVVCRQVYKKVQISQSFQSKTQKKGKRANLEVHYIGEDRKGHKPYQLGKLEVPMQEDFAKQNSYLVEFASHLCPCELRCKQCHGEPRQRVR